MPRFPLRSGRPRAGRFAAFRGAHPALPRTVLERGSQSRPRPAPTPRPGLEGHPGKAPRGIRRAPGAGAALLGATTTSRSPLPITARALPGAARPGWEGDAISGSPPPAGAPCPEPREPEGRGTAAGPVPTMSAGATDPAAARGHLCGATAAVAALRRAAAGGRGARPRGAAWGL